MKRNKVLFMIPSIFLFLLLSIFPVFKILLNIKKVESVYLSVGTILYLLVLILLIIVLLIEIVYLINYLFTKLEMSIIKKLLWLFLLISFNLLIIPYFYMKYVTKEEKLLFKSLLYIIPMLLFTGVFIYGFNVYNDGLNKIKEERKRIEEERNEYKTKDGIVSFIFRHGYKVSEVGEYDLYVKNNEKNVIFTAFTYETKNYEQKTMDDFINKAIDDLKENKEKFDNLKDKEVITMDDKVITTIEYQGKTAESSLCVYKISAISYKDKPDYIVYVTEVITQNNYDLYNKELLEILKTSKLN